MNLGTRIEIPAQTAYCDGHFPGHPILPGVAEIILSLEAITRECHEVITLQRIVYTRLRQIVLPGDCLELNARSLDDGRMRIELKRDGSLVANGEWLPGTPVPEYEPAESATDVLEPLPGVPELDALLPHRPPMRFLQSVLAETSDSLICSAIIPSACALVRDGRAQAVVGLEAAAQAAAAWETLQRQRTDGRSEPRMGYLVALRDVDFFTSYIPADQELMCTVRLEAAALPLSHYHVDVRADDMTLLRGMIATFIKVTDE